VSDERDREVAVQAVMEAARLCAAVRRKMVGEALLKKADESPVTVADFGSQALVCQRIREAFPGDVVVAEEDASALRQPENAGLLEQVRTYVDSFRAGVTAETLCAWIDLGNGAVDERYWTLDPIDGTKGFLRNDQYAVALALVEAGEVKVGVLACPALPVDPAQPELGCGALFVAVRGEGTEMFPLCGGKAAPVRVATEPAARNWRFAESVEAAHGNHELQASIARQVGFRGPSLRMDSQAKYCAVARGDAVLYLRLPASGQPDYREKIWDHAAGSIVVEEAGGRATDMHGRPLDFGSGYRMEKNRGVVVSNGAIHDAVVKTLGQ